MFGVFIGYSRHLVSSKCCYSSIDTVFCRQSIKEVPRRKKVTSAGRTPRSEFITQRRQSSRLSKLASVSMAESGDEGSESDYNTGSEYGEEDEPESSSKVRFLLHFTTIIYDDSFVIGRECCEVDSFLFVVARYMCNLHQ